MDDTETIRRAAILRGLLYLACPDAPTAAINTTAQAIAEQATAQLPPTHAVPEADRLNETRADSDLPRNLSHVAFSGADLAGADLRRANLTGADLSGADLRSAILTSAKLTDSNLFAAKLTSTSLYGAHLFRANLARTDLRGANLRYAQSADADLSSADLRTAYLYYANLRRANLTGANLHVANLTGADLTGADLTGARIESLSTGITWNSRTKWPTASLSEQAEARSDVVSADLYRVRGETGSAPDRSLVEV